MLMQAIELVANPSFGSLAPFDTVEQDFERNAHG
jgi:hypothetical protein